MANVAAVAELRERSAAGETRVSGGKTFRAIAFAPPASQAPSATASKLRPFNVLAGSVVVAAAFFCQGRLVRHNNCNPTDSRKAKWPHKLPDPTGKPCMETDTDVETC